MKLKYIFFIFFITIGIHQSKAQTYKFLTTGFSVIEKNDKGKWGKWSEIQKASIIISVDEVKNRIAVYSREIQLYKILDYEEKIETKDDIVYSYSCTDANGIPYIISIYTRKKQANRKQLYINNKDYIIMYNINNYSDNIKK